MKKSLIGLGVVVLIVLVIGVSAKFLNSEDIDENVNNANIKIVTSLEDKLAENTAWCGTFNLIWNDYGQFKQNIDWTRFYGELEKGTYRIVKDTYDNGYINFYSNKFEIK